MSKKRRQHSPDLKTKVGLEALKGIDAVHVISHGVEGGLILGGQVYTASMVGSPHYASDMARIGRAMSADGDILLSVN